MLPEILSEKNWLSGGHIGFTICPKIEPDLLLICTKKVAKFQMNSSNASRDIGRNKNPRWLPGGHIGFPVS